MLFARDKGTQVETAVCSYLNKQGLRLITRNYHSRSGEIDLIMQDGTALVFVEVRYRSDSQFGSALESVDRHKQSRIIRTAEAYLQRYREPYESCRFDVVGVSPSSTGFEMQWIQNAFEQH